MEFKDAYSDDFKDGDEFLRTVTNAASYDISTCWYVILKFCDSLKYKFDILFFVHSVFASVCIPAQQF